MKLFPRVFGAASLAALCSGVISGPALAWGPEGHTVIARVATANLSPQAKADFQWIVSVGIPALNAQNPGKCRIDPSDPFGRVPNPFKDKNQNTNLANWADCWRYQDSSTAPWHFDDSPLGQDFQTPPASQTWCASGCVSQALADNLHKLATSGMAPADAAIALAYVIHFIGDIHQPLHVEDNGGDRGGNKVSVTTQGAFPSGSKLRATELHGLWDTPLVAAALGSDVDAATNAVASDVASAPAGWTAGEDTVDGVISASDLWATAAHKFAVDAYADLDPPVAVGAGATGPVSVTANYVNAESQVVRSQLDRATARLTAALNTALTWSPPN